MDQAVSTQVRNPYENLFIIGIILLSLLILAIVIITYYYVRYQVNPTPPSAPNIKDLKEASRCLQYPGTTWVDGECVCLPGRTGSLCNREISNYTTGLRPIEAEIELQETPDKEDCAQVCTSREDCSAYEWQNGRCSLVVGTPKFHPHDTSDYHLKVERARISGIIALGSYPNSIPSRFWLREGSGAHQVLQRDQPTSINFYPRAYRGDETLVGFYSITPLKLEQTIPIYRRGGDAQCYIHYPNTDLRVPRNWTYRVPLYVVYRALEDLEEPSSILKGRSNISSLHRPDRSARHVKYSLP